MRPEFAQSLPPGWERFSRFFFALGDHTRQRILLIFDPGEEICVGDIARLFDISRPAVSHHLKILRQAGLLLSEKRGKEVFYRVNESYCAEVMGTVHRYIAERGGAHPPLARAPAESGPVSWDRGTPAPAVKPSIKKDE